jgi:hypothetical protein
LESGVFGRRRSVSTRPAATVAPEEAAGAGTLAADHDDSGPFDDDRRPLDHNARAFNHDDLAVGTAETLAVAMECGTASVGRIRSPKARDRAGEQNCCEKVFHFFSLRDRDAALNMVRIRFGALAI